MSGKSTLLLLLVAVAVVTGVGVLPATDVKPTGTLVFTGKASRSDQRMVDLRPKGISLGDHVLGAETLRQGRRAGRTHGRRLRDHRPGLRGTGVQPVAHPQGRSGHAQGADVDKRIPGVGGTTPPTGDESAVRRRHGPTN